MDIQKRNSWKKRLLDDKEIKLGATKGFNDISEFLENMLKLNENEELRRDYEACLKVLKILNQKKTEKPQTSDSKDVELRVKWDDLEDIGITSHYQGKPFTGKC